MFVSEYPFSLFKLWCCLGSYSNIVNSLQSCSIEERKEEIIALCEHMGRKVYADDEDEDIFNKYTEVLRIWGNHRYKKGIVCLNEGLLINESSCNNKSITLLYYVLRVIEAEAFDDFKKSIMDMVSKELCATTNFFLAFFTNQIRYGLHMYFNI